MPSCLTKSELEELKLRLSDKNWRMSNLIYLLDKNGNTVKYHRNRMQQLRADTWWWRKVDVKTRQQGSSTEYLLDSFDLAMFVPNQKIGIIAHKNKEARDLIEKVVFAHEHLPDELQRANPIVSNNKSGIVFENGSSIWAATSYRSGTLQRLIISEYGYICKKMPDRAAEIRSGALNSVSPDCEVIFESTSLGKGGDFEDMVMKARKHQESGLKLTKMDYRLIFVPWTMDDTCRLDPEGVLIYPRNQEYFDKLLARGISLDEWQKAWYCKKEEEQGPSIRMDYPSYLDEAFEDVLEGAYYANEMTQLRLNHRFTSVPHQDGSLVDTSWDIGISDETAIWFHQRVGREHRIIDYYGNKDRGFDHYYDVLMKKGYRYGKHYLPHDIRVREIGNAGLTRLESFERLFGHKTAVICPSLPLADGINAVRRFLPMCWFDAEKTEEGVNGLDGYTKIWNAKLGRYQDNPLHNWCSNPADSFRYLAICETIDQQAQTRRESRSISSTLGPKPKKWGPAYC